MKFSLAVANAGVEVVSGPDKDINIVTYDSRLAATGSCFVAMRGGSADGNAFISKAVANGCSAIVTDSPDSYFNLRKSYPQLALGMCRDGRKALAGIASNILGHPERELAITGVTGTNGKTTTTWLIEHILSAENRKSILVGTIAYRVAGREVASPHTTPEASDLLRLFRQGVDAGATEAVMEVSSHALKQRRVWGVPFDVAIFTNFSRDHLDFHASMENYLAAKKRLFEPEGTGAGVARVSIICVEDATGVALAKETRDRGQHVETYGFNGADWSARRLTVQSDGGTLFNLQSPYGCVEVRTSMVSRVNVLNIMAAIAAAVARGIPLEHAAAAVETLPFVPGRFQRVPSGAPFTVVVDYAHTDDALRTLTALGRDMVRSNGGRVITIFGCGGDRDKTKRPLMAAAAAEGSDLVVLTTDNPRTEEPRAIFADTEAGLSQTGVEYRVIEDRAEAIAAAIGFARPGDIVLLAGKGHEKTQTLRDRIVPFDDVAFAQTALRDRGFEA